MSVGISKFQSSTLTGLGTYTRTITTSGLYNIYATCSVLPSSSVSIVIQKNGSPIATSAAPTSAQQTINLTIMDENCAVNDVISFVISSSSEYDAVPNVVKTLMSVYLNN